MNFSTHKTRLLEETALAVSKSKFAMVEDFKHLLSTASNLLPEHDFSFWIKQIEETELDEIPITKYGLNEAKRSLEKQQELDRNKLAHLLSYLCEQLFTYSNSDDICEMQSDYHYYFHIPTSTLFKESELGMQVPRITIEDPNEIRIARVSEINPNRDELVSS